MRKLVYVGNCGTTNFETASYSKMLEMKELGFKFKTVMKDIPEKHHGNFDARRAEKIREKYLKNKEKA